MFDLAIIGGGVNGCGIVRDAQGRGLSSLLVEMNDLAGATSSASTKLIHGGLRYLEYYEFRLVREALSERERLMAQAPHIIWPLKFVLPHSPEQRPAWLVRLGLFLYDHLGKREKLPGSKSVNLRTAPEGKDLQDWVKKGFSYSDCWVQDSRLVMLHALEAKRNGADIRTRTKCVSAARSEDGTHWVLTLEGPDGVQTTETARALINAAGPWAGDVDSAVVRKNRPGKIRLVKGSHIILPKLFDGDQAYMLQNDDKRIVFAIPYEYDYTLVGTTDVDYDGDPNDASCSDEEADYLLRVLKRYFKDVPDRSAIRWTYSGVRPLLETEGADASALSRDYSFDLEGDGVTQAPLLSVYGGKITAVRELALDALNELGAVFDTGTPWTHDAAPLPGGDLPVTEDFDASLAKLRSDYPFLAPRQAHRYARNYGSMAWTFLGKAQRPEDLGRHIGDDIFAAELIHARDNEFCTRGEDFYWRRSRLGLHLAPETMAAIDTWFTVSGKAAE